MAAIATGNLAAAAETPRPNVLFIISDDLTAEALACYGNEQCATPNIDKLASRGIKLTRAYCQYPVCGPSRAALMSSLYPQEAGVVGNGSSENFTDVMGERPSMAQHFRENGYYSARVSKIYHMRVPGDITAGVDGPDHAESWDERFNSHAPEWMTEGEERHLSHEKLDRDPDKHYGLGFGTAFFVVRGADPSGADQADVLTSNKAVELLELHRDGPFFLAVGLVRPHVPLVAPAPFFEPYDRMTINLPKKIENDWADIPEPGISLNSKRIGAWEKPDRQRDIRGAYYATVTFMDEQVGKVVDALDRLGLTENTIVVFCSDHGYHLGEHDLWQKQSLHEESARIPLIMAGPGIEPGESDSLAEQIDIYPTLSELAGLSVPPHCRGKSLVPVIRDSEADVRDAVYCTKGNAHLIRTDEYAYLSYSNGTAELYDMRRDPHQFHNLVDDEQHADARDEMQQLLDRKLGSLQTANVPRRRNRSEE